MPSSNNKQTTAKVSENTTEDEPLPYNDSDITLETQQDEATQYSKSEINRMTTAELQEIAFNNGVEDAYEMTGSALKQVLIEKFGL